MAQDTITLYYKDLTDKDKERFLCKVGTNGTCHEWQARVGTNGYGVFSWKSQNRQAHRIAYMIANECDCPGTLRILHSCDNRKCCNPEHLSLGTESENNRQRYQRGRVPNTWCTSGLAQRIRLEHQKGKGCYAIARDIFGENFTKSQANQISLIINNKTWI